MRPAKRLPKTCFVIFPPVIPDVRPALLTYWRDRQSGPETKNITGVKTGLAFLHVPVILSGS